MIVYVSSWMASDEQRKLPRIQSLLEGERTFLPFTYWRGLPWSAMWFALAALTRPEGIMMGACAFLMPIAVVRFIRAHAYHPQAMLGMAIPGIPAVLLAVKFFQNLSMTYVKVLVICVVTYTAISMLRAARRERMAGAKPAPAPEVQPT